MDEHGNIYISEDPHPVDVIRLRSQLESINREQTLSRMESLVYDARGEYFTERNKDQT